MHKVVLVNVFQFGGLKTCVAMSDSRDIKLSNRLKLECDFFPHTNLINHFVKSHNLCAIWDTIWESRFRSAFRSWRAVINTPSTKDKPVKDGSWLPAPFLEGKISNVIIWIYKRCRQTIKSTTWTSPCRFDILEPSALSSIGKCAYVGVRSPREAKISRWRGREASHSWKFISK